MAWLSGWAYRKSHVITGSTFSAVSLYQVLLDVRKTTGSDSGSLVFVGSNVQDDFDDIRVTTSDGFTLLDQWIESYVSGTSAQIWVEMDTIPISPGSSTIYVYYGKADAPSVSNIANASVIGQNFDEQADGQNPTSWVLDRESGGTVEVDNAQYYSPSLSLLFRDTATGDYVKAHRTFTSMTGLKVLFKGRSSTSNKNFSFRFFDTIDVNMANAINFGSGGYITAYNGASLTNLIAYGADTWYRFLCILNAGTDKADFYINGTLYGNQFSFYTATTGLACIEVDTGTSSVMDTWLDDIAVFKYISPEPSHGIWGTEEEEIPPIIKIVSELFDLLDSPSIKTGISKSAVDYPTGPPTRRILTRLSDGTLYVVYEKILTGPSTSQIYVKKSTDGGEHWTDETRLSTATGMDNYSQYDPAIAVDSADNLHVIWAGRATGDVSTWLYYSKKTTGWSTPIKISSEAVHSFATASIAIDSDDYLHVVYTTGSMSIKYTKFDTSWSTPYEIGPANGNGPHIAIDGNNYLHVTYFCSSGTNRIKYTKYDSSWSTPVGIDVGLGDYDRWHPTMAIDSSNNLHVTFHGQSTSYPLTSQTQVWYVKYDGSWSTPLRISTLSGMDSMIQQDASISIQGNDTVHVIWSGKATSYSGFYRLWHRSVSSEVWSAISLIQNKANDQFPNQRWSFYPESNHVTSRLDYVFTEGTSTSDYVIFYDYKQVGGLISLIKTELFGLLDSYSKFKWTSIPLTVTEIFGLLDSIIVLVPKTYLTVVELFGLVDSKIPTKSLFRTLSEILGGIDSQTHNRALKILVEEIQGFIARLVGHKVEARVKHYDKPKQVIENYEE